MQANDKRNAIGVRQYVEKLNEEVMAASKTASQAQLELNLVQQKLRESEQQCNALSNILVRERQEIEDLKSKLRYKEEDSLQQIEKMEEQIIQLHSALNRQKVKSAEREEQLSKQISDLERGSGNNSRVPAMVTLENISALRLALEQLEASLQREDGHAHCPGQNAYSGITSHIPTAMEPSEAVADRDTRDDASLEMDKEERNNLMNLFYLQEKRVQLLNSDPGFLA